MEETTYDGSSSSSSSSSSSRKSEEKYPPAGGIKMKVANHSFRIAGSFRRRGPARHEQNSTATA